MLDKEKIERMAVKAGKVAYAVLGLKCEYSIALINNPDMLEDAAFDTMKNEILINLNQLEPFPIGVAGLGEENINDDNRQIDEEFRYFLKICYLVFHEMRHLYQLQAIKIYEVKQQMGGCAGLASLEPAKKVEIWQEEFNKNCVKAPEEKDVEMDANDFAYYLTNRYPIEMPMQITNRRRGAMKLKYDKIPIPEV